VYSSRALELITERLQAHSRCQVLDLGPAIGDNINYFARYRCKLYIEDCAEDCAGSIAGAQDSGADSAASQGLRSIAEPGVVDIVLAWDLFDYLSPTRRAGLGASLARVCKPKALLFTLVHTGKQIPALPSRYVLLGEERIGYQARSEQTRACPQHHQATLLAHLPGFHAVRSMLLRNGSQEYVLQFQ